MLEFVGLQSGRDYTEVDICARQNRRPTRQKIPDGVFLITSLPSGEIGDRLVHQLGYRLMELPFGEAMALRNPSLHDMVIPAFSYGIHPPVPDRPLHTLGQRLLIVANRDTSSAAIERLMSVIFESEFRRRAAAFA